jgi:NADH-quinone oxidoreductase subunit D
VDDLELLRPPDRIGHVARRPTPVVDEPMVINLGPQHPSTHGVLRLVARLSGETVISVTPDVGYLHTGIEKTFETKTWLQGTVLAPRMGYLSPIHQNLAYALAVEQLLGVDVPPRATVARVLLAELDRLASHLVFVGSHAIDLGATSLLIYAFRERDSILDIMEMTGGARMFPIIVRPGGLARDLPEGFAEAVTEVLDRLSGALDEYEQILTRNPLWLQRTVGVAVVRGPEALALGVTGPTLRAAGVALDLRKAAPYCGYETYDFEVPVATAGDAYARYVVRMAEMRQSIAIARQALARLEPGPVWTADRKVAPPPKEELATSMEAVIHHFKLWTEGYCPPAGEAYASVEAARGEMGFYVVSDGSGKPWRVHMRSPSFANMQALDGMCRGGLVADVVTAVASLDPILGEIDR